MRARLSVHWRIVAKSLMAMGLLPVVLAASSCRLLRKDEAKGDDAAQLGTEKEDPFGGGEMPTFDNAAEAILASRPVAASAGAQDLEEAFKSGDYTAALSRARLLGGSAAPGSEDLDAAVFVEGASLYYLGRHAEAQRPLDRHRSEFSDSRYKESSQYYAGSNLVKQARWREGGAALDVFMNRYPESLLMEYALYDRATAFYALGELDKCYAMAGRLENDFIYSKIKDRAAVLRGEVLKKRRQFAQAEAEFLKAKNAAESLGHTRIAARALANLIAVSAEQKRWDDSVDYYETFFGKYSSSPQAPAAALAGLPALKEKGKLDSGLDRMESVLLTMPEGTSAKSLKTALSTYAKFYREQHGPEQLLRRYGNLSSSGRGSETLREQLIIARLEVLETYFPEREAEIGVFYDEIRSRFERSELATPTVLKLADRIVRDNPARAVPWYQEALSRQESQYQDVATLGLAKAKAQSTDPTHLSDAEAGFRRVLESYGSPDLLEEAVLGMARVSTQREKWPQARDYWARYVENPNWTLARDEAVRELTEVQRRIGVAPPPPEPEPPIGKPDPAPEVRPAAPANGSALTAGKAQMKLKQAERLVASGKKAEAYEVLKSLIAAGEKRTEPDAAITSTLRRAGILKENLGLELDRED